MAVNRVLNVGGGPRRDLPSHFKGWEQALLDVDPSVKPDVVCDARTLRSLPGGKYEAVYCSHTLEHFYKHEVPTVLAGFVHVLKKTGFVQVAVPDMGAVFEALVKGNRDIGETWYMAGPNPITFHDVIYGWGREVGRGNLFYAHKCGFTEKTLGSTLRRAGFAKVLVASDGSALHGFAFRSKPSADLLRRLGCH